MRVVLVAALTLSISTAAAAQSGAGSATRSPSYFVMPSRNVVCLWSPASRPDAPRPFLRCDVASGLRPKPARPPGCDTDWSNSIRLDAAREAENLCAGDTVFRGYRPVLRYGRDWSRSGFVCHSRTNGLTCVNDVGHGFFVRRGRWVRF